MVPPHDRRLFPGFPASANDQDIYLGLLIVLLVVGLAVGATRCTASPLARFNQQLHDTGASLAAAPPGSAGGAPPPGQLRAQPASPPTSTWMTSMTSVTWVPSMTSVTWVTSLRPDAPEKTAVREQSSPSLTLVAPPKGGLPLTGLAATLADLSSQTGAMFGVGGIEILPPAQPVLDRLVGVLLDTPATRIQVAGHTDNDGTDENNGKLGQQRAEAVRDYLAAAGIAPSRLIAVGYGGSRPVARNDDPAGRALNRRIEFLVLP